MLLPLKAILSIFRVQEGGSHCYHSRRCSVQGALAVETKRPYIRTLQCAMCGCLQKATAMRPNAIFFLLHCCNKPQNYGLALVCFALSCNPGAINLSRVVYIHMESEKHAVSSPRLKLPGCVPSSADHNAK